MPTTSSSPPAPEPLVSWRTRWVRRAPVPVQPQLEEAFGHSGLGRMVAGGLLVLLSVVGSATSCSYLSLGGERFSSGWLAGLMLFLGLGLLAHGWFRGSSRS